MPKTTPGAESRFDARPQYLQELADPLRMGRPGRRRHQVSIRTGVGEGLVDLAPATTGLLDVGFERRIGGGVLALQHPRGDQDLLAVANGRDGLVRRGELAHDLDQMLVEP